jgi:hypothetical protein
MTDSTIPHGAGQAHPRPDDSNGTDEARGLSAEDILGMHAALARGETVPADQLRAALTELMRLRVQSRGAYDPQQHATVSQLTDRLERQRGKIWQVQGFLETMRDALANECSGYSSGCDLAIRACQLISDELDPDVILEPEERWKELARHRF